MKPQFLIDACLTITDEERESGLYIPHIIGSLTKVVLMIDCYKYQ